MYDILWSDGKATQEVRPVSDGVVPIGLCVIPTNWLDEGEKARFVSLKHMSSQTPASGGLDYETLLWGVEYDSVEQDPLKEYYMPYVCKNENSDLDVTSADYRWAKEKDFKDLRDRDNWLYTLNYCKQNPGKYAIGDINGKQNTVNISVEENYSDKGFYANYDMKSAIAKYAPAGTQAGDWYVPAAGELLQFMFRLQSDQNSPSIDDKVAQIAELYPEDCISTFSHIYNRSYWSSTIQNNMNTYYLCAYDYSINFSRDYRGFYGYGGAIAYLMK